MGLLALLQKLGIVAWGGPCPFHAFDPIVPANEAFQRSAAIATFWVCCQEVYYRWIVRIICQHFPITTGPTAVTRGKELLFRKENGFVTCAQWAPGGRQLLLATGLQV